MPIGHPLAGDEVGAGGWSKSNGQPPKTEENLFYRSEVEAMKFRPLHDRVVVRRVDEETKTTGGIIIPDTAKEKPMQGEILAVGPGARDEAGKLVPLDVKKGDRVLFGKWSGTEVKIDGEELLIMKESDILGIIEGKASVRAAA
jgi:chaperonin GroES